MMSSVQNTCPFLYFLIILSNVPMKAEVLRCYVCVDCDTVNETHISTCVKPDDSVTESPITLEPSTNTIIDTVSSEDPDTTITNTPGTEISSTNTPSTETMATDDTDTSYYVETSTTEDTITEAISTETPTTNELDSTTVELITDTTNTDLTSHFTPSVTSDTEDSEIAGTNGFFTEVPSTDTDNQHTETYTEKSTDLLGSTVTETYTPEIEVLSNEITVDINRLNSAVPNKDTSTMIVADIVTGEFVTVTPILKSIKKDEGSENIEISRESNDDLYLTDKSNTHRHPIKVHVSELTESKKSRFMKYDKWNEIAQSSMYAVEMLFADHKSRPRRGVIHSRREVITSGSEVRCVVASYAVNNKTRIVRGCSFLTGHPEDRCRELVGGGFIGNLTRCSICEGSLCNSAIKPGIIFTSSVLILLIFNCI